MKVVVQRAKNAQVVVDETVVGKIDQGLMVLVGFTNNDTYDIVKWMAHKVCNLRIFPDEQGIMNKSVIDIGGKVLSVSQFTLYGDAMKGNRPSYQKALNGAEAEILWEQFNREIKSYVPVETGKFGAHMEVTFTNMGPSTIIIEKEKNRFQIDRIK